MSLRKIDPLQFVKSPMPLLSADKRKAPERALGRLEGAAARDETCVWQRVSRCMFLLPPSSLVYTGSRSQGCRISPQRQSSE